MAGAVGEAPLFEGPVFLFVHFHFEKRNVGDTSNLVKAIEDGLNGKKVTLQESVELSRWHPEPHVDVDWETFDKGDTLTLGKAWVDDRKVAGLQAFKTFATEGGEAEPFTRVMVTPAGHWKAWAQFAWLVEHGGASWK